MTVRQTAMLALTAALLAGCSGEAIGERIAEEAVEQAGGGDGEVDIDLDDDSGSIAIESSEGSMSMGAGGELPASFPEDLPLPEGEFQVMSSFEQSNAEDGLELQTALMTSGSVEDVAAYFEEALPAAGYEIADTQRLQMDGLQSVSFHTKGPVYGAVINVGSSDEDEVLVNYAIGEVDEEG